MASIVEERIVEQGVTFSAMLIELENAMLTFLYEGEKPKLGTVAIALPIGGPSSIMMGDRYIMATRMIAERISSDYSKIAIVSTFVRTLGEAEAGLILAKLAKKLLKARRREG